MSFHTIRFRGCIAQQDNKTLEVFVRKEGYPEMRCIAGKKLSGKELRTYVARYLKEVMGEDSDGKTNKT